MNADPLTERERAAIRHLRDLIDDQVDEILRDACRIVAELTKYTSVATPPIESESRLDAIRLLLLDARRLLVVLVLGSGRVAHAIVDASDWNGSRDVESLQSILNGIVAGKTCGELRSSPNFDIYPPQMRKLLGRLCTAVADTLRPRSHDELVVHGEANVLREPEFQDLNRLDGLLDLLHSRQAIYDVLSVADMNDPVAIIIGSENEYERAREYSFVAAPYLIGPRVAGTIGVLGPTRMRYSQAIPVVTSVAHQVSMVLSTLSGALA
jgi:heat-inducible transcriptional repressor